MRVMRCTGWPAFAVGLIIVAGCGRFARNSGSVVTTKVRAADGVAVAYDVRGQGDTALVFIHGWACDRSFWREQLDVFAEDYRVVALDLGGHGESGADREEWSLAALAGDVQAVVERLDLDRVVLVGHSMGGAVALEAARLMPQRVAGIVGVDTLHDAEVEYGSDLAREAVARFQADFRATMVSFVRPAFGEQADPALVDWVIAKACAAHQKAALALVLAVPDIDLKQSFEAAKVPIRCVNAGPAPPLIPYTQIERNRRYADFDAVIMEDVGHFLMLERPAEFNRHLRRILSEMLTIKVSPLYARSPQRW